MGEFDSRFEFLAAVAAVVTLPLGILALFFLGFTEAVFVFVVGWFLLVPLFGVLNERAADEADAEEAEGAADRADETTAGEDPLETLRERYARGEIDEAQFERKLERLVATEEIPREAVSAIDPDDVDGSTPPESGSESEAEPERLRER